MDAHSSPTPVFEWAAAFGAVVAFEMQNDQARPMQSVQIEGVLAEEISDHFTREERNLLLYDGISTHYVDASGIPRIERCITTYKTSPLGAVDTSYLDVNTLFTLSYIRFDLRTHILNIFPRHKLAKDGTLVQPGQPIVRPSDAKEEAIIKARQWESKGLIESADNFKDGLITEINSSDPNRLDWVMSPDLMNQLRVNAIKIGFKL
jgi:phage tail sheath gpL-like